MVAPAHGFDRDRYAASAELVRGWGYTLVEMPNLYGKHRYLAGTTAARTADLSAALTRPDIDAVWFVRGGYGTVQVLDGLPWGAMDRRPVIGFSDATALFAAMVGQGKGRAVHGPVLYSVADHPDADSVAALRALLGGAPPAPLHGAWWCGPQAPVRAPVVGGNLCVLASIAGTRWALSGRERILALEEIAEPPYKVDRMLTQLKLSGCFEGVLGIALGDFTRCDPPATEGWSLKDVLIEHLAPLGVPVVGGLPFGHGPRNHPWEIGALATLSAGGLRVG